MPETALAPTGCSCREPCPETDCRGCGDPTPACELAEPDRCELCWIQRRGEDPAGDDRRPTEAE